MDPGRKNAILSVLQEQASWEHFLIFRPMFEKVIVETWKKNLSEKELSIVLPLANKFINITTKEQYERLMLHAADRLTNAFDDILALV